MIKILCGIMTSLIVTGLIFLLLICPGCTFIKNHPKAVEEIEEVGEKVLEAELGTFLL